jgi:hypothetical protein
MRAQRVRLGWKGLGRALMYFSRKGLPAEMVKGVVVGAYLEVTNSSCLHELVGKSDGKEWMVWVEADEACL